MDVEELLTNRVLSNLPPEVIERDFDTILSGFTVKDFLMFVGNLALDFIRTHPPDTVSDEEKFAVMLVLDIVRIGLGMNNQSNNGKEG